MTGDTGRHIPLEPAPVWLRLASTGLHLAVGGGVMTLASVVLEPVLPSQERRNEWLERWEPARKRWHQTTLWSRITRHRDGAWLGSIVGLQVVDARTGGPMTLSSAIREEAFDVGIQWLSKQLWGPGYERFQRRREAAEAAVRAEMDADPSQLPDDPEEAEAEIQAAVAARMSGDNGCLTSCLIGLAVPIAPVLTVPFNPRRQSLRQMAAGVMVVRASPTSARRG